MKDKKPFSSGITAAQTVGIVYALRPLIPAQRCCSGFGSYGKVWPGIAEPKSV